MRAFSQELPEKSIFWPKSRKNSENWQNLIIMSGNFGLLNQESGISEKFAKSTDFTPQKNGHPEKVY